MKRMAISTGRGANSSSFPRVTSTPNVLVQRSCACGDSASLGVKCEDCANGKLKLQRSAGVERSGVSTAPPVPPIVHEVLRSPGQPLDRTVRAGMEAGFGHDFSRVRVHTDRAAAESAREVNARAFTVGEQIVFGEHQYAAGSASGKRLLAHELVHTIQQRGSFNHGALTVSNPTDSSEREADAAATAVRDQQHSAAIDQQHPGAQIATAPALLARAPDDPQPTTNPPTPTPTPSTGDAGTGTSSSAPANTTPAEPTAAPDAGSTLR